MDVRLINPFIESTLEVFETMVGLSIQPGERAARGRPPQLRGAVSAMISMRGGAQGVLVLRFPRHVVTPVVRRLDAGAKTLDDILDAVGELANMICGSAKHKIADQLVEISVPRISIGDDQAAAIASLTPWLIVPFEGDFGSFDLSVSFRFRNEAENPVDERVAVAAASTEHTE